MANKTVVTAEPGKLDIVSTREFDAPRELVYQAYIDPVLLAQWLGPGDEPMDIREYNVSHGGSWRYVHTDEEGNEWGFRGVFHGDASVENGIMQTFEFEGAPGHVCLERVTFEDLGNGRSQINNLSVYQTLEARDGMIASGMEGGMEIGFQKLDALLAEQQS